MINQTSFDIRYIKLHFTIEFTEDSILPVFKASALRGGMGEMLLRACCIRNRECENCDFESECLVRRIMYSKMEIQPSFMTSGDSVGYAFECEDYRSNVRAGDTLQFNLLLFGKTIVYCSQILSAFYSLGMNGLGKEMSRFRIVEVTNSKGVPILDKANVLMQNLEILKVSDYIAFRKEKLSEESYKRRIAFKTPLSLKYHGNMLTEFIPQAIIESACRRIYMLDCLEGIESDIHEKEYVDSLMIPKVLHEEHKEVSVRRYSNHKETAMYLKGIEGEIELDQISPELLDILLAGELIHIGKNTSFGFGRYRIS